MKTFHPKIWTVVVATSLRLSNALEGAAFAGIVFDAFDDFSTVINSEASTWSYRSSADDLRDGNYSLLTTVSDSYPLWDQPTPFWNNAGVPIPGIGANESGAPLKFVANSSTFYWPDKSIWMHPYEFGLAVLSWRSPSDGVFDISFSFTDMDPNGVTAGFGNGIKWFVDRNDTSGVFALAQGTIAEGGASTGLMTLANISVFAGDRIDFVVSANGNYNFDSTGITATISAVPEPSSLVIALTFFGSLGLAGVWNRRSRQPKFDVRSKSITRLNAGLLSTWSTALRLLVVAVFAGLPQPTNAGFIGPTPYLAFDNSISGAGFALSPFAGQSFTYFYLETFEDHLFNTPGVTASAGAVVSVIYGPSSHDSVDADDGVIDGNGLQGDSFYSENGAAGILFTFNAGILGALPTHAGIVWTDGAQDVTFRAFGQGGSLLGTIHAGDLQDHSFDGGTSEDRFLGVIDLGGISAIFISNIAAGIEVDHLQFGLASAQAVPEPSSIALLCFGGIGLAIGAYRRRGGRLWWRPDCCKCFAAQDAPKSVRIKSAGVT